jgi:glycosyltransferase involved in cell wall biosynthesis
MATSATMLSAWRCVAYCPVAFDTPSNREVVGDAGLLWRKSTGELSQLLTDLLGDPARVQSLRAAARERVRAHYSWEDVADDYDRFFRQLRAA